MKQLNIFELQNSINKKKQNRTQIYENVLEKCHLKINRCQSREIRMYLRCSSIYL